MRPERTFDEIGVVDYQSGVYVHDAGTFRKVVSSDVCSTGGDAVLAEVSGQGRYMRGTIIRYR